MNMPSPPFFLMRETISFPSFSRRPETTTFAPSRANASAVAEPMPLVPPVTSATLLVNVFMEFPSGLCSIVILYLLLYLLSALHDLTGLLGLGMFGPLANRKVFGVL